MKTLRAPSLRAKVERKGNVQLGKTARMSNHGELTH